MDNGGWSSGVLVADVNNDGWLDIYICRELYDNQPQLRKNQLYMNNGLTKKNKFPTFTESAEAYGLADDSRTRHATFIDYDKDGYLDLFLLNQPPNPGNFSDLYGTKPGPEYSPKLYRNNGNQTFTDVTSKTGVGKAGYPNSVTASDLNNDGWTDLYITNDFESPDFLYINNGDGTFSDVTSQFNLDKILTFSTGATFGDINGDGFPELFVGNYFDFFEGEISQLTPTIVSELNRPSRDHLFMNNAGSYFTEMTEDYNIMHEGFGFGGAFTDYDNDGDLDLYVVNDFGNRASPNRLYKNEFPKLPFEEVSEEMKVDFGFNAMGTGIGDINNDGWLDYQITNITESPIVVNQGNNQPFIEKGEELGTAYGILQTEIGDVVPVTWGTIFFDYDNDTDLDLFNSNGALNPSVIPNPNLFFENQGEVFIEIGIQAGLSDNGIGRGAATFDYDNDGDLDLFVVNQTPVENAAVVGTIKSKLYRNDASVKNWLKIKLNGLKNESRGLGSRIEVYVGNLKMIREIDGGSSHESQNSSIAHFGLGDHTIADSVVVRWLDGQIQSIKHVEANQLIEISEVITDLNVLANRTSFFISPGVFNRNTTVYFPTTGTKVYKLVIYNEIGETVEVLLEDEGIELHKYQWEVPLTLRNGVYFFRLSTSTGIYIAKGIKR
jgi:hypothetical protein